MLRLRCAALIGILWLGALASQALGQTVGFRDGSGATASTYVEKGRAIVQVEDPAANVSGAPDTVQARLTSTRGGDEELLILTETGPSTGVFRGTIALAPANGSAQPGVLETAADFNPPYERDTIRAEYGPASATATMVGSKLEFLDPYRRPTDHPVAGAFVLFRLTAPLANTSPGFADYVEATATTSDGDYEPLYLNETGPDTGIFEGGVWSSFDYLSRYDSQLELSSPDSTITGIYSDSDLPTSSQVSATGLESHAELVDATGQPAEYFLESSRVYIELTSAFRRYNDIPTLQVKVTSDLGGDAEVVTLQEREGRDGHYLGSIAMRRGPGLPGNGILETTEALSPARFDTVRVERYPAPATPADSDAVPTLGSLVTFRDEYGNEVSRYAPGSTVVVRVEDHNFNDPGAIDSVQAVVQSLSTGDAEPLTLQELARDSGLFEARILALGGAPALSDGRLQVMPGEQIQAMHVDAFSQLASAALARVDALAVMFIDAAGRATSEVLQADRVRVRVVSVADNADPSRIETISAQIATQYAADQETVQLTETGPDTGVFEGSIPSQRQPGLPGNGVLEEDGSGPPDFHLDTLTASVGPYSATAHVVGARLLFIDEFGRPATSFAQGETMRVRVIDYAQNNPGQQDMVLASLYSPSDYETINLMETGYDTGVFEGGIASGGYGYNDYRLMTSPGVTVGAGYDVLEAHATITGGQVLFVDDAGQPAGSVLEGTKARVRVIDHGADLSWSQADTVTVSLATDLSGDAESLTLTETGPQTGLFEGTIPLRHGPVLRNSGKIEPGETAGPPHQFDTVRVSYTAVNNGGTSASEVGVRNYRVWFIDTFGNLTDHYAQASTLRVRVEDHREGDPGAFDHQTVRLQSSSGDVETLDLLETGRATGIFEGSMPLDAGTPANDARLQAAPGSEITAALAVGYTETPARARVDSLSVQLIDEAGRPITEVLQADRIRVRVISSGDNLDLSRVETVPVEIASQYAADRETLQLTETGPDTGVFEGSIPSQRQPGLPGNGILEEDGSGPPEYRLDTVTASVGPYSATARVVAARLLFIDEFGRPATSFAQGETMRVRVIDYAQNNPGQQDMVLVSLYSPSDYETFNLMETGYDTGVFEGGISSGGYGYGDFRLMTSPGVTVGAVYGDSPNAVEAHATITGGQVLFVDDAGQPAGSVLEGTKARVRVIDHGADLSWSQADTVTVSLATDLSGDAESLTLTETGPQTGLFEGTIPLRHGPVLRNSGKIEPGETAGPPHEFDTIRVSYAATNNGGTATSEVGVLNFRVWFIDADGNVTDHYAQASPSYVRVEDHRDGDPGTIDHRIARLQSSSGDAETLQLSETGKSTGIYEGSMPLDGGAPAGDTRLQAAPGSEITAALAEGYTAEPARARVDALSVQFIDETGRSVTEVLQGDRIRVRVVSPGDNLDPSQVEMVPVELSSRYAADHETVLATETGPGTGVFEGSISSRRDTGLSGNGTLEVDGSGPPEYRLDTVTASVGPYSVTAQTVEARLQLIDDLGRPATSFPQGGQVRARVIDYTRNNPEQPDSVLVQFSSPSDYELIYLQETGNDTGVFEGGLQTGGYGPNDFQLLVSPGDTVSVVYGDYPNVVWAYATIREPGHSPQAIDDAAETLAGHPAVINVLANDTDPDGDPLSVVSVTQGENGTVVLNADGTVTYAPNPGYTGPDSFTYEVSDPSGGRSTGNVLVTVTPANHPPVANDDAATVSGNGVELINSVTIPVLANDTDPDGDVLTVDRVLNVPSHSTATVNSDGTITYTPGPGFTGVDQFAYEIHDSAGAVTGARVTVTVARINHAPVANNDSASIQQGGSATIDVLANDTDADGDPLMVTFTDGVINPDGTVTFTPRPTVIGLYPFSYTVSDGHGGTASASVLIFVNAPPVANADSAAVSEDGSADLAVLANDTDPNGDALTVTAVTQGAHGTVAINPDKTVKYTPAANYNGPDSFTYTVSDGKGGTATGTVTVTVTAVNDAPVANADTATVEEDGTVDVAVLANDTDVEGDTLTVTAVTQGAHGTAAINPDKTVRYTPAADYNGPDTFTYNISDGNGGAATGTVTVTVSSGNDAPVANADTLTVPEDTSVDVAVLANDTDADGDALTVTTVAPGAHGTVMINPNGTVRYRSAGNYNGPDAFTYTVSDGHGGSATAQVTVTVTPVNDPPVTHDDFLTSTEDEPAILDVLANDTDPDGDPLHVFDWVQPVLGTVTLNPDNTLTYTPPANFNGGVLFYYRAADPSGLLKQGQVFLTVKPVDDPAVANPDTATVSEDGTVTIDVLANDVDVDNRTTVSNLSIIDATQGAHGRVKIQGTYPNKTLVYTPDPNFNGTDTFTYRIELGSPTGVGTVTVTVTPVNDAPAATADSATVAEDGAVSINVLANDSDVDGDVLTVTAATQGSHGTVAINPDKTVRYTPAANYNGPDSFTYTVSDGNGGTAIGTVAINVTPVNDGPAANPDAATVAEDGAVAINVLANDSDPEGDVLSVISITQGVHGTVSINPDKTVTYTPAPNYNGADAFAYTISDGNGGTASGTVAVNVTPVNDAPVAVNDSATVAAGSPVTVSVLANDADLDGPALAVTSVTQGAHGAVTINADQTVTYTAGLYVGADSFTYTISDGAGGTATATVAVNVTAPVRVAAGIQARYDFNEGSGNTLQDTSGAGAPLDLTIGKLSATSWTAGGLTVLSNAEIESVANATKIINAAQASNAVTLEAWVRPSSLTLNNGRIAMISKNPAQRNLVFAQSGSLYEAQLRTSGGAASLQTPAGSASLDLVHLVYTRSSSGQAAWYLNGVQVSTQTAAGNLSAWGADQKLILSENWQGTYFLLAVYGRALSGSEVQQNYLAGVNAN